jgi:hypothetical protein
VSFSPNIFLREKLFSPNLVKYKQLALCVRACVQTCSHTTARLHYRTSALLYNRASVRKTTIFCCLPQTDVF